MSAVSKLILCILSGFFAAVASNPHHIVRVGNLSVFDENVTIQKPHAVWGPSLQPLVAHVWTVKQPASSQSHCFNTTTSNSSLYFEIWLQEISSNMSTWFYPTLQFTAGVLDATDRMLVPFQDIFGLNNSCGYQRVAVPMSAWPKVGGAEWGVRLENTGNTQLPPYQIQVVCLPPGAAAPCPSPDLERGVCSGHGSCTVGQQEGSVNGSSCTCDVRWGGFACSEEVPPLANSQPTPLSIPAGTSVIRQIQMDPTTQSLILQLEWAGNSAPFGAPLLCLRPFASPLPGADNQIPSVADPLWVCDRINGHLRSQHHYLALHAYGLTSLRYYAAVFNKAGEVQEQSNVVLTAVWSARAFAGCPFNCTGKPALCSERPSSIAGFRCSCPAGVGGPLCEAEMFVRSIRGDSTLVSLPMKDLPPGGMAWHAIEVPPVSAFNPGSDDIIATWQVPDPSLDPSRLQLTVSSSPDLEDPSTARCPTYSITELRTSSDKPNDAPSISLRHEGFIPVAATSYRAYILLHNADYTNPRPAAYQLDLTIQHALHALWHRPGFWSVLIIPAVLGVGFLGLLWGLWHWRHYRVLTLTRDALRSHSRTAHPMAVPVTAPLDYSDLKAGVPTSFIQTFPIYPYTGPLAAGGGSQEEREGARHGEKEPRSEPGAAEAAAPVADDAVELGQVRLQLGPHATCSVCLLEYEKGEVMRCLPCAHEFHRDCIDGWMSHHTSCPICRRDLLLALLASPDHHVPHIPAAAAGPPTAAAAARAAAAVPAAASSDAGSPAASEYSNSAAA